MASLAIETGHQEIHDLERNGHAEKAQWVLNAPEPPSLWQELTGSIRETVLPHARRFPTVKDKGSLSKTVISFLHAIFPIFCWCRNYKATNFKNDLLAGLTLASLCIPQVKTQVIMEVYNGHKNSQHCYFFVVTNFLVCLKIIQNFMQSIGYATLAKLDPQYGLCKLPY
jgi:hypothetical protein